MVQVPADPEKRKTSIEWPTVIDDRLRLLVDLASQSAELDGASSANELLAALVSAQPLESDRLARLVKRHRNRPVDQIAAANEKHGGTPSPRRGRPRSGSSLKHPDGTGR